MSNTSKRVIFIKDQDGDDSYVYAAIAPDGMNGQEAEQLVNEAVRMAKDNRPEDYSFDDLERELVARGFEVPLFGDATERW
jgi:hypothetical protein